MNRCCRMQPYVDDVLTWDIDIGKVTILSTIAALGRSVFNGSTAFIGTTGLSLSRPFPAFPSGSEGTGTFSSFMISPWMM